VASLVESGVWTALERGPFEAGFPPVFLTAAPWAIWALGVRAFDARRILARWVPLFVAVQTLLLMLSALGGVLAAFPALRPLMSAALSWLGPLATALVDPAIAWALLCLNTLLPVAAWAASLFPVARLGALLARLAVRLRGLAALVTRLGALPRRVVGRAVRLVLSAVGIAQRALRLLDRLGTVPFEAASSVCQAARLAALRALRIAPVLSPEERGTLRNGIKQARTAYTSTARTQERRCAALRTRRRAF
jgi:hypothetical protein